MCDEKTDAPTSLGQTEREAHPSQGDWGARGAQRNEADQVDEQNLSRQSNSWRESRGRGRSKRERVDREPPLSFLPRAEEKSEFARDARAASGRLG